MDLEIRRSSMEELYNPLYYRESDNLAYYKYHVYTGTTAKSFKNCIEMETIEYPNTVFKYSSNYMQQGFTNMPKLKSIKMPKCYTQGHYPFADCSTVTYIQLGSVGYEYSGMGYWGDAGIGGNTVGTAAGLTLDCYIAKSKFSTSWRPTGNTSSGYPSIWYTTIMRVYDYETGTLLGIYNKGGWTYIREEN